MVAVLVTGMYFGVRHRYRQAVRQVTSDIQVEIDLERWSLDRRDVQLFLSRQDETSREWYGHQLWRYWMVDTPCGLSTPGSGSFPSRTARQEDCPPAARLEVREVDLRWDIAWVEVITGRDTVRRARFYRRTDRGWLHTAPRFEFWKEPVKLEYGNVTVRAHRRDLPHIEPLVAHIAHVTGDVRAVLGDAADGKLVVDFVIDDPSARFPDLVEGELVLASPWLVGIPVEGPWTQRTSRNSPTGQRAQSQLGSCGRRQVFRTNEPPL
jgi:hypothetical protein